MMINSASLIFFSPTGATKRILYAIAEGMGICNPKGIDLTLPDMRINTVTTISEDILIIGIPVYEERIPKILYPFLNGLKGSGKPVALVAVYGNVGEGIVLSELKSITENSGFTALAAGSFIGRHSFSTKELPLSEGRPDQSDLEKAGEFGRLIKNKLEKVNNLKEISLSIPKGKLPLMARILPENSARMFTKTPSVDLSLCDHCGVCVKLCPMSAIDGETLEINENQCLRCFRCVRKCHRKAREITYKRKILVTRMLTHKNKVKKEPKIYL